MNAFQDDGAPAPARTETGASPVTTGRERTTDRADSTAIERTFDTPLAGALECARRGWRVFPVEVPTPGDRHTGKSPLKVGPRRRFAWQKGATTDPEVIRSWFDADGGGANYGLPAALNGHVVLDEDRPGAIAAWATDHGFALPATYTVKTGEGRQLRFDAAGHTFTQSPPVPGLDIRFEGYGVGPGSVHYTGALYSVLDGREPVPLPAAAVEALTAEPEPVDEPSHPVAAVSEEDARYALDIYARNLRDLAALMELGEGDRDYRGHGWDSGTLHYAARGWELVNATGGRITAEQFEADFLRLIPTEYRTQGHRKLADARERVGERRATAPLPAENAFGDLGPGEAANAPQNDADDGFNFIDWDELLDGDDVPPEWVMWPFVQRGSLASLSSEAKAGKSLLTLEAVFCAITGRAMFGVGPVGEPVTVLYLDQENSRRDLKKRLMAMGATADDLRRLHYASFPKVNALDTAEQAQRVIRQVQRLRPDVLVFDTASRFVQGEENDAPTWLRLYRLLHAPVKNLGVAQLRIDHLGKDHSKGARGSSAKDGDVDDGWLLKRDPADARVRKLTHPLTRNGDGPSYVHLLVESDPLRHVVTATDDPEVLESPFAPVDAADLLIEALYEIDPDGELTTFDQQSLALRKDGHRFKNDVLKEARRRMKGGIQ